MRTIQLALDSLAPYAFLYINMMSKNVNDMLYIIFENFFKITDKLYLHTTSYIILYNAQTSNGLF